MEERSDSTDDDWTLCAVCGYPLMHDPGRRLSSLEWNHGREADHVPIPVDAREMSHYNGRCDFCDDPEITSVILADDFVLPGVMIDGVGISGGASRGSWGACQICGDLAEARAWNKLATRVRKSPGQSAVPARMRTHEIFFSLYTELEKHMRGRISLEEWRQRGNYPAKST